MVEHFQHRLDEFKQIFERAISTKDHQYAERAIDIMMYTIADGMFCHAHIYDYKYPIDKFGHIISRYGDYVVDIIDLITEAEQYSVSQDILDQLNSKRKALLKAMLA